MAIVQGFGNVGGNKGYRRPSGQEADSNSQVASDEFVATSRKTWGKLPDRAMEGKPLQNHLEAEFDDNPAALKKMVTDMLRMSREASETGHNFRDGQWPVDGKLMGPTRIPIREIEDAANHAYHALTGQLLELPDHLRP